MGRIDWPEYWFAIARVVATRATCPRKAVGAVICDSNRILSTGYNGAAKGKEHCSEVGCDIRRNHCTRAVHAEINALQLYLQPLRGIRILDDGEGLEMYCTLEPCNKCAKELAKYLPKMKIYFEEENNNK